MLVLKRKKEQSVVVGGFRAFGHVLKVTILEIGNEHVKLGFEADEDVPIHRSEVWTQVLARLAPAARPQDEHTGPSPGGLRKSVSASRQPPSKRLSNSRRPAKRTGAYT
jgi:carbon storage regulator CsrA